MAQLGRIGGPLLADNLLRNGSNLAFENNLLYIDVVNKRIGIKTSGPGVDLQTPNAIDTVNLTVSTMLEISNNSILSTNNFYHYFGPLNIQPNQSGTPTITAPGVSVDNLYFTSNSITNGISPTGNVDITLNPTGSGQVIANGNVLVNGNLHSTGNITFDGNITLGNEATDTITFLARVNSDIVPTITNTYSLGSSSLNWANLYATGLTVNTTSPNTLTATTLNSGNISITGNTITNNLVNSDLIFAPNGTGQLRVNGSPVQYVSGNNIVNPIPGTDFIFNSTDLGHFKIAGTNGVSIPTGISTQYPSNPEQGAFRYNSQLSYAEIYSGSKWQPAYGIAANATQTDVSDLSTLYSIVFGF
jgi:hypothetical protein